MNQKSNKKILVIDDDQTSLRIIDQTLTSIGYDVIVFTNPDEAVKNAEKTAPDLVFIGLLLAGSNGLKVSKAIHSINSLAKTPVIMMTSYAGELDPRYTVSIGIPDVIVKPLKPEELASKTARIFGKESDPSVIRIVAKEPPLRKGAEPAQKSKGFMETGPVEAELQSEDTEGFGKFDDDIIELEEDQEGAETPAGPALSDDLYSDKELDMEWDSLNMPDEPDDQTVADTYTDITDEDIHEVREDDDARSGIPEEDLESQDFGSTFGNRGSDREIDVDYPDFAAADEKEDDNQPIMLSEEDAEAPDHEPEDASGENSEKFSDFAGADPRKSIDEEEEDFARMLEDETAKHQEVEPADSPEYGEEDISAYQEKKSPARKIAVIAAAVIAVAGLVFGGLQIKKIFFDDRSIETYLQGSSEEKQPVQKETIKEEIPPPDVKKDGAVPSIPVEEAKTVVTEPAVKTPPEETKKPLPAKPQQTDKALFSVQIGAFSNEQNAAALTGEMKKKGYDAFIQKDSKDPGKVLHRVLIGRFNDRKKAVEESRAILQKEGIKSVIYQN